MAIFPNFFLGNIGRENVFYDILERNNAFLGDKNKKFTQSKIWHFSKGVNAWFWSKNGYSSNFFLGGGNISQGNVLYDTQERKNAFLDYKGKKFQRGKPIVLVQKWPFFQLFFLGNIGQENVF